MTECKHGLDPATCTICLHGVTRSSPEQIEVSFLARFDGHCPECNLPIAVGQRIVRTDRERYLHAEGCAP